MISTIENNLFFDAILTIYSKKWIYIQIFLAFRVRYQNGMVDIGDSVIKLKDNKSCKLFLK